MRQAIEPRVMLLIFICAINAGVMFTELWEKTAKDGDLESFFIGCFAAVNVILLTLALRWVDDKTKDPFGGSGVLLLTLGALVNLEFMCALSFDQVIIGWNMETFSRECLSASNIILFIFTYHWMNQEKKLLM